MIQFLSQLPPIYLALICGIFTWLLTAIGAAAVLFFKRVNNRALNIMMGFAAGVMIAASVFSLIMPAMALSVTLGYIEWLMPSVGFMTGGLFVLGASKLMDKFGPSHAENPKTHKRSFLLVFSITLHNIPEGLSMGVAAGAILLGIEGCDALGALALALAIGLQNLPEGASVSIPLRRDGFSRRKAFFYGQASGIVEPVASVLGFIIAAAARAALPFLLTFAAGAMIAVVASEIIPEANENKFLATLGCITGFVVMMILDVALG